MGNTRLGAADVAHARRVVIAMPTALLSLLVTSWCWSRCRLATGEVFETPAAPGTRGYIG
jgi:hypothetical protein